MQHCLFWPQVTPAYGEPCENTHRSKKVILNPDSYQIQNNSSYVGHLLIFYRKLIISPRLWLDETPPFAMFALVLCVSL